MKNTTLMIEFEQYTLKNGLRVILHHDHTTPLVVINTIYNVGARDETPNKTGFAHLFEHLMFGGSINIPNFDKPLQLAGGECNAFTNNDITNYYSIVPTINIETALWLESDRMLSLAFNEKSLQVQKNVVIEEYKQRYLNQPYGDIWHIFRPLIYKNHPYSWPTIGKEISHIENATMQDVKAFFKKHYSPTNAILVIGGSYDKKTIKCLIEKWYSSIPSGIKYKRQINPEPIQTKARRITISRKVPSNAIYLAFRIGNRTTHDHYLGDIVSDILSAGKSSRMYKNLVKEKSIFSQINAFISSGFEHGMFIIGGFLLNEITLETAEKEIWIELENLITLKMPETELKKVKNKFKTAKAFQNQSLQNRVMSIAQLALINHLEELNSETKIYNSITSSDIQHFCQHYFTKKNSNTLHVIAKQMNRSIAPKIQTINSINLLNPQYVNLGNEIKLYWIKDLPDNTVKLDFIWDSGSKYQNKLLTASYCNHLLFSGNETESANVITEKIDSYGGYLSNGFGKDQAGFTVFGLSETIETIFEIVATSFSYGVFPCQEINKWAEIQKKNYMLNEEKVSTIARKIFTKKLFSEQHSYGKLATIEDFSAVTQLDLQQFYKKNYRDKKPSIYLVGNVSENFIKSLKMFANQFGNSTAKTDFGKIIQNSISSYKQKKGAVQTAIRIGRIIIDKKHPDFIPFQVLSTILGGYFGSRLMENIREDKGYTYGIGSGVTYLEEATYFFISTEVAVDKREDTLREIYFEIDRLKTETVLDEELAVVKNYMIGDFLRDSDGAIAMMEKFKSKHLQNLPTNYYSNFIKEVNNIKAPIIKKIAIKYLSKADLIEISYG